ncbi:hypothetical protein HG530_011481 [Fusarium avenaceum]|nr:hypothetical protein HG530_011481 [Fusarium avenaceum]
MGARKTLYPDSTSEPGEEDCSSCTGGRVLGQHGSKECRGIPDRFAHSLLRSSRDQDTNDRSTDAVEGESKGLSPDSIAWLASKTRIVILVKNTGRDTADRRHDARDHQPGGALRPTGCRKRRAIANGIAEAVGAHGGEGPYQQDEEEDQGDGAGDVEEVLDAMRSDPEEGQRDDAEDEVREELRRRHAGRGGDRVGDVLLEGGIPRQEHEVDALSADPGLEAIPD